LLILTPSTHSLPVQIVLAELDYARCTHHTR